MTQAKAQQAVSTHSRPKAAELKKAFQVLQGGFQHTAARRRLILSLVLSGVGRVSTHSRPKAAAIQV